MLSMLLQFLVAAVDLTSILEYIYISRCAFEMNLTVSSQYRVLANGAT